MEETCHCLEFATSTEAWEKLNEYFITLNPMLFDQGSVANSSLAAVYNVFIKIRKAWVDPDFDYGRHFNYTESKWTTLLNNYVDFNQLDLIKSKIKVNKASYNQNYNLSYLFNNSHVNGKQCLLSATFSRRFTEDVPVITMVLRSSEITKRLIFDFLLIQRMGEYIYGKDATFQINLFATQMYGNIETLCMYEAHRPLKKLFKSMKDQVWKQKFLEVYNKFTKGTEKDFSSYKVFLRCFKVIRPDLYTYRPLIAKNMFIEADDGINYPEDCISFSQRKAYKKKFLAKAKKQ